MFDNGLFLLLRFDLVSYSQLLLEDQKSIESNICHLYSQQILIARSSRAVLDSFKSQVNKSNILLNLTKILDLRILTEIFDLMMQSISW
jgi:hypothetical protein